MGTRIDNLHAVASSGSYADLINKPSLFSGNYNDLSNKPSLFSGSYDDLANKPSLFSGSYNDLSDVPAGTDLTGYATETYVNTAISNLVDGAPSALNTLNELADAINDNPNVYDTLIDRTASSSTLGQIRIGYSENGKNYPVEIDGNKRAYVNVPWVSSTGGGFSGAYADLTGKPTIPTNNNQLTNGAGYITASSIPSVPTNNNQLTNGANYITASDIPAATSQDLGGVKVSFSSGNLYISTT